MVTIAELWALEGAVVAVGRGVTAELVRQGIGATIRFESVAGGEAVVRVLAGEQGALDAMALCPIDIDAPDWHVDAARVAIPA